MPGAVSPQLDFTLLNGVLFVSLIVLIIYGILLLFIQSYVSGPGPEDCLGSGVKGWWCQDGASERQSRDGSGGTFLGKCLGERKGGGTTKAGRVVQPRGPMRPQVRDRKGGPWEHSGPWKAQRGHQEVVEGTSTIPAQWSCVSHQPRSGVWPRSQRQWPWGSRTVRPLPGASQTVGSRGQVWAVVVELLPWTVLPSEECGWPPPAPG